MRTFAQKPNANQQTASAKSAIPRRAQVERGLEGGAVLHLQRTIGNQAVQRLLQSRTEESEATLASRNGAIPPSVHQALSSPGRSLDPDTRSLMESRFGHDFSHVRVHTDSQAAGSARAVNAIAYTVGHDVVLPEEAESVAGSRLLAHELAHVVQQTRGEHSDTPLSIPAPNHPVEREANNAADAVMAGHSFHPVLRTGLAMHRQAPPPPPATLAGLTATRVAFNNAGAPDADNCAAVAPAALGVDGPAVGQNGMEMIFRINGAIPPGTEFDITRTVADGLWHQDGGAWARLGGLPAGTSDDHHDQDECLTPVGSRIFVVDTPGLGGSLNPRGVAIPGAGTVSATATAAAWKLSFAEWVIARNRRLGIGWQRISTPTFHRWHSVLSVALVGGTWARVDTPSGEHNEIELGSTRTTGATP
jgi:hypothetical protein